MLKSVEVSVRFPVAVFTGSPAQTLQAFSEGLLAISSYLDNAPPTAWKSGYAMNTDPGFPWPFTAGVSWTFVTDDAS
jgi:hypothetical protein